MRQSAPHILVADDASVAQLVLGRVLKRAGFIVTFAKDGSEAWQLALNHQFDAVVTDQQMPVMCGTELCNHLRQLETYRRTPIVMVTSKAYELDLESLRKNFNVSEVFVKPFSPSKLIDTLKQSLQRPAQSFPPADKSELAKLH